MLPTFDLIAVVLATLVVAVHVATAGLASFRLRGRTPLDTSQRWPAVTVIRPVCGIDPIERETLASTFSLGHERLELIFCAARATDPAVPFVRGLIERHSHIDAKLMIGHDGPGANPKLDNVRKGWRAARHDWVIIADSNVSMPTNYVAAMLSGWRTDTGLVCAPPIGVAAEGLWAAVEAQFLNTYQARWQYAADQLGCGFAQGKSMLFHRPQFDAWGGIAALDSDLAEDAAATKVVRRNGRRIHLAPVTFGQPLGRRRFAQIMSRQCRWAQLRRHSFPWLYALEPLSMLWVALGAAGIGAIEAEISVLGAVVGVGALWFGAEVALARQCGWHAPTLATCLVRETLTPIIWVCGWRTRLFTWRQPQVGPLAKAARAT